MLKRMYEQMLLIRRFEEALTELFQKGVLSGTIHCCIGQEAVAVGVLNALSKNDIVASNHRGHGHFIAFTNDVEGLMAEIMGKKTGVCGGRGGTQHLHKGNFYSNGITGGMCAVATGMAFAEKVKKSRKKVVAFFGDGALAQGIVYESWNMASLWKLPIIYVIENNFYAMSTRVNKHFSGSIKKRAEAFEIKATELFTNDVIEIYNATLEIVREMERGIAPQILVCNTYRFCGHSKSDDLCYRTRDEEALWSEKDPIKLAGEKLSQGEKESLLDKVDERIKQAMEKAQKATCQDPIELFF